MKLLRRVKKAIRNRQYRPHPTRLVRIEKVSGGWRELRIATIVDRVIATALTNALEPILDRRFLPSSYGFRPGKSREEMLAQIMHDMVTQSRYVIGLEDVRDAFPSVRLGTLFDQLRGILSEVATDQGQPVLADEWMRILETVVWGAYPNWRDRGLEQGSALSPLLMNVHLDTVLDQPQRAADRGGVLRYRFADNTVALCRSTDECQQALTLTRNLLRPHGLDLKGWNPINLARHGAVAEILGFTLQLADGIPQLHLKDSEFADLSDDLAECYEADDPGGCAVRIARGWLEAMGPAFEFCEEEWVLDRLYRAAAYSGFRELGPARDLRETIQQSRSRWLETRSKVGQPDQLASLG